MSLLHRHTDISSVHLTNLSNRPFPYTFPPTARHPTIFEQVLEHLAAAHSTRVLRLTEAEGAFGGWVSDPMQATLFSTMMEYYLHRGAWCCTSRFINGNADNGRVYLRPPPPLKRPPR